MYFFRIYTLLLSWTTLIQKCVGQKDFLTILDDRCITNTSSATALIYDLSDPTFNSVDETYWDDLEIKSLKEDVNDGIKNICDGKVECFKKKNFWGFAHSLYPFSANNLITDRRWEEFPTFITSKKKTPKSIKLYGGSGPASIPFSVQTDGKAHVFICEGALTTTKCYWLMFQGYDLKSRMCGAGEISQYNGVVDTGCKIYPIGNIEHKISGESWTHLKIVKYERDLYLEDQDGLQTIIVQGSKIDISLNYLFFYTTEIGLWKLHSFSYLYMEGDVNDNLDSVYPMTLSKGNNCLAMFAAMCQSCYMDIKLENYEGFNFVFGTETKIATIHGSQNNEWKEIKHTFHVTKQTNVYLRITPKWKLNIRETRFWAFNNLRTCNEEEIRVLKPEYPKLWKQKCQLIDTGKEVEINNLKDLSILKNCAENQLGEDCLPCENIFTNGECPKKKKYCQLAISEESQNEKCYCSIGYTGEKCEKLCVSHTYGHGCQKSCGNCQDGCQNDTISGNCNSDRCSDNYMGRKCNTLIDIYSFKDLPSIEIGSTSCNLSVQSFERRYASENLPQYYKFQYMKESARTWSDVTDELLIFNISKKVLLRNLKPKSKYSVRVFGFESEEHLKLFSNINVDVKHFTTKCEDINITQLEIEPSANSVEFWFSDNEDNCDLSRYTLLVYDHNDHEYGERTIETGHTYNIKNLEPLTEYTINIMKYDVLFFTTQFQTTDSVPRMVENFYCFKGTSDVLLTWSAPTKPYGKLLYYTVSFKLKKLACKESTKTEKFNITIAATNEQDYELRHTVMPYSDYYIEIRANTSAGFGPPVSTTYWTEAAEHVDSKEIPNFDSSIVGTDNVVLKFNEAPCDILTGPIYTTTTITSETGPWCNETKANNAPTLKNGKVTIEGLKPFCEYNATVKFYRINEKIDDETTISFKTLESAPNEIKQLEVTSKGSTHISFRWLPPSPPTGQLSEYKLSYCFSEYSRKCNRKWHVKTFTPSSCKVWPQFHCYKLIGEKSQMNVYFIKIESKNTDCEKYSKPVINGPIWADDNKKSQPPYGLNVSWTKENYLYVSWYHPNTTNGVLTRFKIYVYGSDSVPDINEYKIETEDDYLFEYNKTITSNLTFPDDYKVNITAVNLAGESPKALIRTTSPPPIPVHEKYIMKIMDKNMSISISFNELKPNVKRFQQYLYVLITECDNCEGLVNSYKDDLVEYHEIFNVVRSIELIKVRSWKAIVAYDNMEIKKYSNRTLNIGDINVGDNKDDIIYSIKPNTTYNLAFIWIHKLASYVRMNSTIISVDIGSPPTNKNTSLLSTASIVIIICLLLAIVIMMVLYIRWKKEIHKKAEDIYGRITASNINETLEEVHYENHQLPEEAVLLQYKKNRISASIRHMPETICPGNPLFKIKHSQRISIRNFRQYVKNALKSNELNSQHNLFQQGPTRSWTYGALPQNKTKNRYTNLIAYNHSRVVLNKIEGDEYSDYINASYIDGYQIPRAYIATQGPKKNTLYDFWRMIWQEKVTYIVMMANVIEGRKKKVEQYWPNNDEKLIFGDFKITFLSSEIYANFEFRKFQLHYQYSKPREICQLHFKAWPDHGVPLYPQSLVPILEKMLTFRTFDFPMVVHCSAGVGRTGTVILCDICLRMAASEGFVDVLAMLEHLRNQRANMVDNIEQYKLAHLVILNCLAGLKSVPINKHFTNKVEEYFRNGTIASQLQYIRDCEWEDDAMKTLSLMDDEEMPLMPEKDRFPYIIPDNMARVFLHPYPLSDPTPSSTYINAVRVDGFCEPGRFIVTQFPLPNTVGDFWRLVAEKDISVIICLNDIPMNDESCELFFPIKLNDFYPEDNMKLKHVKIKNLQVYSILTFEMTIYNSDEELKMRTVEIVQFRGWKVSQAVPDDYMDFITFTEDGTSIARKSSPTLITCYDGATASGLFIAMSFLLEKLKLEQVCDVCQAVRSIRTSRKEFTNNEEQLEFLYKAALLYVEDKFNQYANMG